MAPSGNGPANTYGRLIILNQVAVAPSVTKALDNGVAALLRAYDVAFVASLEKLRGPITADDHAHCRGQWPWSKR